MLAKADRRATLPSKAVLVGDSLTVFDLLVSARSQPVAVALSERASNRERAFSSSSLAFRRWSTSRGSSAGRPTATSPSSTATTDSSSSTRARAKWRSFGNSERNPHRRKDRVTANGDKTQAPGPESCHHRMAAVVTNAQPDPVTPPEPHVSDDRDPLSETGAHGTVARFEMTYSRADRKAHEVRPATAAANPVGPLPRWSADSRRRRSLRVHSRPHGIETLPVAGRRGPRQDYLRERARRRRRCERDRDGAANTHARRACRRRVD